MLLEEALAALAVKPDGIYIDGTYGRGGHARAILARLGPAGRLLVMDRDPEAVIHARGWAAQDSRVTVFHGAFSRLQQAAAEAEVENKVSGVLLDIGVSSLQLDDARRGFSFTQSGPLDMRMDPGSGESAAEWLAHATEGEIADVIHRYGEERHARRIARAIVAARRERPLNDTLQLAELIARAVPRRDPHKHPATRTFQAVRIFINRELDELAACLEQCLKVLAPAGRLVAISFHSLEDRIVKRFIRDRARGPLSNTDMPWLEPEGKPELRSLGKPVYAGEAEVACNPRARSAVLRVAEKLA